MPTQSLLDESVEVRGRVSVGEGGQPVTNLFVELCLDLALHFWVQSHGENRVEDSGVCLHMHPFVGFGRSMIQ